MSPPQSYSKAVQDYFPWPDGLGFQNTDSWWRYVYEQSELDRLNLLMALALLSPQVSVLLLQRDQALYVRFSLSETTVRMLSAIEAASLEEFALMLWQRWPSVEQENSSPDP